MQAESNAVRRDVWCCIPVVFYVLRVYGRERREIMLRENRELLTSPTDCVTRFRFDAASNTLGSNTA